MRTRTRILIASLLIGSGIFLAFQFPRPAHSQGSPPGYGEPLPGLTGGERALFNEGGAAFGKVLKVPLLGPTFNARSCAECHGAPAPGGGSNVRTVRYGKLDDKGRFDPLESQGGSLLKLRAVQPWCMERMPDGPDIIKARRRTPAVFGAGLIEAIPDEAIIANAENQPKEVQGRVHVVTDLPTGEKRVGRFGWKTQVATLLDFSSDAALNEMGLTNRFRPTPNPPNGNKDLLALCNQGKDPKDTTGLIDKFTSFVRFLAPPPRGEVSHNVEAGEVNFMRVGCGACHTPSFTTGPNTIAALDRKRVSAYSDFLLHDIGTGDGIEQGDAKGNEIKTPPLWGLSANARFLHDSSAVTIEDAIRRHGGQAAAAREAFEGLQPFERQALLRFLESL